MTSNRKLPSYRHHKPSNQAFVQIKKKRHYLGIYDSPESKRLYAKYIADLAVKPESVAPTSPRQAGRAPQLTIFELTAGYLEFAEGYYQKNGEPTSQMGNVKRAITSLVDPAGDMLAAEFGPVALRAVQDRLVAKGLSRSTVNGTVDAIRRIFRWGVSHELLPVEIYQALTTVPGLRKGRTPAREPKPIQPVDDAVVEATLPHVAPIVADMIQLQRASGMRPSEVCILRPGDVDRSGEVWSYTPASHKTEHHEKQRVVFLGPRAQAILTAYLLRPADAFCFSPAEAEAQRSAARRETRKTRVQPSQKNRRKKKPRRQPGNRYTVPAYRRAIARGVLKANRQRVKDANEQGIEPELLPEWSPNQLRHSTATEIRRTFGSLEAAQVVLGHANARITEVYAERDQELARKVMGKIG